MNASQTGTFAVKRVIETTLGDTITTRRAYNELHRRWEEDIVIEGPPELLCGGNDAIHGKTWP